eukprot:m.340836 g.340836  ORF g.340836 m.340836 type:complete len:778 (-) comp19587_c0_seq1:120-2453(-)
MAVVSSIIKFTALSGAYNEESLCYLLEIDDTKLLLDCGWTDLFDVNRLNILKRYAPSVDAVLITYPDLPHMGALPYAVAKLGLQCPIYCTMPVRAMGELFLYDAYQSRHSQEDFELFGLEDIDEAMKLVHKLEYSETVQIINKATGMSSGVVVQPHLAGHMIGGSFWRIYKEDAEEIMYAVDYNHRKERHLAGSVLESVAQDFRPSVLITDAFTTLAEAPKRRNLDVALLENVLGCVRNGGNCMIVTDTAGRVLELLQVLVKHAQGWEKNKGLHVYRLIMLNFCAQSVIDASTGMLTYAMSQLVTDFEKNPSKNPFNLPHVEKAFSVEDMHRRFPENERKVVLVSQSGLESGASRKLCLEWADNPKNLIFFAEKPAPGTLGYQLTQRQETDFVITIKHKERVPLMGQELVEYLRIQEEEREAEQLAEVEAVEEPVPNQEVEDTEAHLDTLDYDSGDEQSSKALLKHDIMEQRAGAGAAIQGQSVASMSFFKQAKGTDMFPYVEEKTKKDAYGELIRHDDYRMPEFDTMPMDVDAPSGGAEATEGGMDTTTDRAQIPTKCIESTRELRVRCKRLLADFEGRSDGYSAERILNTVKPKSLIVIHGTEKATLALEEKSAASVDMKLESIECPHEGDTVDVTSDGNIYQVLLTDALATSLQFSRLAGHDLAWVEGVLNTLEEDENGESKPLHVPVLQKIPKREMTNRSTVFVGQPRLSDLIEILKANGIKTQWSMGTLVCNGTIQISRTGSAGGLVYKIEGDLSDTYYLVRDLLYQQFATV